MSLDELITQGQDIDSNLYHWFGNMAWYGWIMFVVCVILSILMVTVFFFDMSIETLLGSLAGLVLMAIIMFIIAFLGTKVETNPEYTKWEEDALNYIENLPQEKYEVVYIKLDPESTTDVRGTFFLFSGSIHSKIEKSTPVTIAYKVDDEIRYETFWTKTNMKLSKDDKPYVTFKNLPKNLGHGIDKGWYNPTVHLPSDYEFIDIK
ncbi:hypothetical protein JOC34_000604 [Virgibacillus halotolerans]|uniref:hypothetical protein n=1 Tax=Virgibacillus halotolerans TaxID=1071053 RepID=UPI001960B07D|nr:hypothetical protein [Virgibacillus halotolerans]MBM7598247.1 hypothetical protein [Virgibacillus halotolerans]